MQWRKHFYSLMLVIEKNIVVKRQLFNVDETEIPTYLQFDQRLHNYIKHNNYE